MSVYTETRAATPVAAPDVLVSPDGHHLGFWAKSEEDFDVTLVSQDRVRFRVSANILRSVSKHFEQTLSLPQNATLHPNARVIDNMSENAQTLAGLLMIVMGRGIPTFHNLDAIEPLLFAAEKYEMHVPLTMLRLLLLTRPQFLEHHIHLYFLGCRLGWDDVAKLASKYSCDRDLFLPHLQPTLRRIDPKDLLVLMAYHRKRREATRDLLNTGELALLLCTRSDKRLGESKEFENFRWRVLDYIERTPSHETLSVSCIQDMYEKSSLGEVHRDLHDRAGYITPQQSECCAASQMRVINALETYWKAIPQTV